MTLATRPPQTTAAGATPETPGGDAPIGVLMVDDSAVVRAAFSHILEAEPDIRVIERVGNAARGLAALQRHPEIRVVLLDIEMPGMDGLSALPQILSLRPDVKVLMASTLTQRNAEISLRALTLGAADYVPKPSSGGDLRGDDFKRELIDKIRALGKSRGGASAAPARPRFLADPGAARAAALRGGTVGPAVAAAVTPAVARPDAPATGALRPLPTLPPQLIAVGSSTGGPQALFAFLKALGRVPVPVVITQHMPPSFTRILAEHIGRQTGLACREGAAGEALAAGDVVVAPGGLHLGLVRQAGGIVLRTSQDPPENFCRPAVDFMLRDALAAYGARMLAVILTGMGADGCRGARALVDAGGHVLAQDEASSVVWGMPGAVAREGLVSQLAPPALLGAQVRRLVLQAAA